MSELDRLADVKTMIHDRLGLSPIISLTSSPSPGIGSELGKLRL
ncbi:MAG TPA: hypothetical protein VJK02_07220 [Anaerolineales bacterium]|nr:hypothetical protein [Anaerolineales bacterium]